MEEIRKKLIEVGCVKFGDFKLKSGKKSNVYVDLRNVISYPNLLQKLSGEISGIISPDVTRICGVPYAAIPVATQVSVQSGIPMILKRKEVKEHGTKKLIEGEFVTDDAVLLIEDVITSGESLFETINELESNGLIVQQIIVILDREEGGMEKLKKYGYNISSLFKLSELIIEQPKKIKKLPKKGFNKFSDRLLEIAHKKKSNLIISADLTTTKEIISLIKEIGENICAVKLHSDIIVDFNSEFIDTLKYLAKNYEFLIIEDRKFADIGNTQFYQFTHGIHKISSWADIITTHLISGTYSLQAFNDVGILPIIEMSSEGTLTDENYIQKCKKIISQNPQNIIGAVCQKTDVFDWLLKFTPGVNLVKNKDLTGQKYTTPKYAIEELCSDFIIVGRGIYMSSSPREELNLYLEEIRNTKLFDEEGNN